MARGARKTDGINFEASLKRLEEIVRRLEDEQVPLEESLRLFAEGKTLARGCEAELQGAENRIRQLTEDAAGTPVESVFEPEQGEPRAATATSGVGADTAYGEDEDADDSTPAAAPPKAAPRSSPRAAPLDDLPF